MYIKHKPLECQADEKFHKQNHALKKQMKWNGIRKSEQMIRRRKTTYLYS